MKVSRSGLAAAVAVLALGLPCASTSVAAQTAAPAAQTQGPNDFGKTDDFDAGRLGEDVYIHGYYCDSSIPARSQSGCEVGTAFKRPPSSNFDPLYITVPLGFTVPYMEMQCPSGITCVDHPATIDLTAIGLPGNAPTPGHDHFTTTTNNFEAEWWDVEVVGVKNRATYDAIHAHRSFAFIQQLINAGDPNVTKPIPTNLFLFFAVRPFQ